jgi:CRP/FNR family transcriptional regulator, cyclic AMP receptor protein
MALSSTVAETLSQLSLFADLSPAQVEAIAHGFGEQAFGPDQRVLRQNLGGSGLFIILEGEAAVRLNGQEVARLGRGDFFGEISALSEEAPNADVVATSFLRCLVVPEPSLEAFLLEHPPVLLRMLKVEVARLRLAELAEE